MFNKNGFIQVILTPMLLIILAVIVVLLFGGLGFIVWLLSVSLFKLIGGIILIFASYSLIKGTPAPIFVWIIGGLLILLPFFIDAMDNLSLSAVGIG